jgi:NodT family efflux transporter outer membrane factor (OMF) lipoprotein
MGCFLEFGPMRFAMQTHRPTHLFAALAVVLAGCGSVATEKATDADAAEAIDRQIPVLGQQWSTAASSGAVQSNWIESFGDPALTALVIEAQSNNPSLAAAAANLDRSWALARSAGAALMPDANLVGLASESGTTANSASSTSLILGARVSWEPDLWGRLRAGRRSAQANAQSVEADFRSAQYSLAAATARAYFTAIEARNQADIAREAVSILEGTLQIVNLSYENGHATAQDVSLSRSDLATARGLEGAQRDAVRSVEAILGRYPEAVLEVREALPEPPPPPPAGLPSELLERRPDLVAAERRVASAFNATAQVRTARLPTIGLTGTLGNASDSLSDLLDPGNAVWIAGSSLLAPIYDGGRREAALEVATADQERALAAYGQTALNAFREVEMLLDQGLVFEQQVVALSEAVTESEAAFRIVTRRYEEGEESLLSVLTIRRG